MTSVASFVAELDPGWAAGDRSITANPGLDQESGPAIPRAKSSRARMILGEAGVRAAPRADHG